MHHKSDNWLFLKQEWRFLAFGLLLAFWSSPGQTFVISLFGGELRQLFDLSHGEFGALYTGATLLSAAVLWKAGPLVDRLPLKKFAFQMALIMVGATALFATIQGPITLLIGIFAVRFMGQGMLNHISVTAMARRYEKERGRAVAIAGLGFPLGEAIFPPIIVLALGFYDWRFIWPAIAIFMAITLLPLISKLITPTQSQDGPGNAPLLALDADARHWTRAQMLRDTRFYLIALTGLIQSALVTGLFFHQVHFISLKGWSFEWWSLSFTIYALSGLLGGLISGVLVDIFSARKVVPYVLIPLACALIIFGYFENSVFAAAVMAVLGFGAGATNPALSSLWPELYGTRHLGAIRSVATVVMVFGSALGPVFMGWALDGSIPYQSIMYTSAAFALICAISAKIGLLKK